MGFAGFVGFHEMLFLKKTLVVHVVVTITLRACSGTNYAIVWSY